MITDNELYNINITDRDIYVLLAIKENGWDTNTSNIKEFINRRDDLDDINIDHINYRLNQKFNVDEYDNSDDIDMGWIETYYEDEDSNDELYKNSLRPKNVRAVDKESIEKVLREHSSEYLDNYDNIKQHVNENDKEIEKFKEENNKLKEKVKELESENTKLKNRIQNIETNFNQAITEIVKEFGGDKETIKRIEKRINNNK